MRYIFVLLILSVTSCNFSEKTESIPIGSKETEFITKVYNFCIDNIRETAPYAHYDWSLDNIIIDGDNLQLIDWDLCAIYTDQEIKERFESQYIGQLYSKLHSS